MQTYPEMNEKIIGILRISEDAHQWYAAQRIEELEAENGKLRAELKLRRHQMSQFPFCPDHRDKVHGLECRECEIERLRIAIIKLLAANEPPEEG